jgi:hypothetical protein
MSVPAPRVASQYTSDGHQPSLKWTVFQDSLLTVLRTRRRIPAVDPQKRRNKNLIKPDDQHKQRLKRPFNDLFPNKF